MMASILEMLRGLVGGGGKPLPEMAGNPGAARHAGAFPDAPGGSQGGSPLAGLLQGIQGGRQETGGVLSPPGTPAINIFGPQQGGGSKGEAFADFLAQLAPAIAMIDPRNQQLGMHLMQMNADRRKGRKQQQTANQTLAYLRQKDPEVAQLVEAGLDVKDAYQIHMQQEKAGQLSPSEMLAREKFDWEKSQAGNPTDTQKNLEWRAQQAGLQPGTPEYADFMIRGGAGPQVAVNVGGETLTPGQKKIDEAFADTYLQWTGGGWADSAKQIEQLTESLDILDRATKDGQNISGVIGALPSSLQPFINPEGTIAREGVEEVVQRSLREILGAQFTEREGERLIARAYNPALPPAENAKRVRRLLGQIQSMGEARQTMVDYFDKNGTLRGFKGRRPSLSDLNSFGINDDQGGPALNLQIPGVSIRRLD